MSAGGAVRRLLPADRISEARIRNLLGGDPDLDRWSRNAPGALRPRRLAALIRDRIWEGHDVSLAAVRARLATRPGGKLVYRVTIEVDVGGRYIRMVSQTSFAATARGSVRADIDLTVGNRTGTITAAPILLKPAGQERGAIGDGP